MSNKQIIGSFLAGFLCIGILSCDLNRKEKNSIAPTKNASIPTTTPDQSNRLKEEQFFDIKRVKEIQTTATETQKIRSGTYLQKALSLFSEQKIEDCMQHLVQSISNYPTPEAYLGLGNSNLELGYYEDAIDAYHMAEWLNYEPLSDIYYHMAAAYFKDQTDLDGKNRAIKYLKLALDNGYENWAHFASNEKFGKYRYQEEYINLFLKHFQDQFPNKDQALFQLFVHLFPEQDLPVEVLLGELNSEEQLGNPYPMSRRLHYLVKRNSKQQFHPQDQFFFKTILEETDRYYTIIYQRVPKPTYKNKLRKGSTYFDIATYTKNGRMIDQVRFAGNINPLAFKAGIVNKNKEIEVIQYKATWQQEYRKYGSTNNQIEHFDYLSTKGYMIGKNGRFVTKAKESLLGLND